MKHEHYTLLAVALPLLFGAAANAPQFKNPAVRDAYTRYQQARNGYKIALQRGISLATREKDQEQVDLLEAELAVIVNGGRAPSSKALAFARDLVGTRWIWNGGPLHLGTSLLRGKCETSKPFSCSRIRESSGR